MFKLNRAIYAFLNRYFPEQAYRFVPRAPEQLRPSQHQLQMMDDHDIHCIRLEFRPNCGMVVQRSYWLTGEKDSPKRLQVPRDVLLVARKYSGGIEVHAGPGYKDMPAAQFEDLMSELLANALESIEFIRRLNSYSSAV